MTRRAARMVAAAIREGARQHADAHGPGRYRATVTRWAGQSDFAVDVHGLDMTLSDDDVTLSQAVRDYDARVGIAAQDVVILLDLGQHDFSAVAVESDTEAA